MQFVYIPATSCRHSMRSPVGKAKSRRQDYSCAAVARRSGFPLQKLTHQLPGLFEVTGFCGSPSKCSDSESKNDLACFVEGPVVFWGLSLMWVSGCTVRGCETWNSVPFPVYSQTLSVDRYPEKQLPFFAWHI